MFDEWETTVNAADAEAHSHLFSDDSITIPPNRGPFIGKESSVADLRLLFSQSKPAGATISEPEIEVAGDWADVRAHFRATWEPVSGGPSRQEHTRYIWVLRRQPDGAWKIARFIFYPTCKCDPCRD
jgi:ketosteroid isomerase-like protein